MVLRTAFARGWKLALISSLSVALAGCLSPKSYVDTALPVVQVSDLTPASAPQPVQLLFEFRTRGTPNAKATEFVKPKVFETVRDSKLFREVSETPVQGGRTLTITIDNVRLGDPATAKAFGTGLTFGLVGTMVSDGYVCTATYTGPRGGPTTTSVKHALHTTIGNASGPPGVEGRPMKDAIDIVVRQMTMNVLKALSATGF
jgi:hypothetical protein